MTDIKNLFTEGTANTPQIDFSHLSGELILSGKSIPENAARIYEPVISWINDYIKSPRNTTNLRLNLEYFNSASSIWITKMVRALCRIRQKDSVLFIHIYFDIEDFEDIVIDELKDIVGSLVDNIGEVEISIGIRTYGTDSSGKILKETMVLI